MCKHSRKTSDLIVQKEMLSGVRHDTFFEKDFDAESTRTFGQVVGLLNYLSADQPDCCFKICVLG